MGLEIHRRVRGVRKDFISTTEQTEFTELNKGSLRSLRLCGEEFTCVFNYTGGYIIEPGGIPG